MTYLVPGWFGLGLLRLRLLTLVGLLGAPFRRGALLFGVALLCSGRAGLEGMRFARIAVMLLMHMMLLMKAVVDVPIQVVLTFQGDRILAAGPVYPVTLGIVMLFGVADVLRFVSDHHGLSDFIHGIVVHRRDEAIREWRNWLRENPFVNP